MGGNINVQVSRDTLLIISTDLSNFQHMNLLNFLSGFVHCFNSGCKIKSQSNSELAAFCSNMEIVFMLQACQVTELTL